MKTLTIITTYNRQAYLDELLPVVAEASDVWVFDDGSDERVYVPQGVNLYRRPHHGRENYYTLIRSIFKRLRGFSYDRLCMLPDDVVPASGGVFDEMEYYWDIARGDGNAIALNPLVDGRGIIRQWESNYPVEIEEGVWLTGWNDLCFYGDYAPLANALSKFNPDPPAPHHMGSGVGGQLSRHLRKYGNLYQVDETIWKHREGPSVMCPEHREKVPL